MALGWGGRGLQGGRKRVRPRLHRADKSRGRQGGPEWGRMPGRRKSVSRSWKAWKTVDLRQRKERILCGDGTAPREVVAGGRAATRSNACRDGLGFESCLCPCPGSGLQACLITHYTELLVPLSQTGKLRTRCQEPPLAPQQDTKGPGPTRLLLEIAREHMATPAPPSTIIKSGHQMWHQSAQSGQPTSWTHLDVPPSGGFILPPRAEASSGLD